MIAATANATKTAYDRRLAIDASRTGISPVSCVVRCRGRIVDSTFILSRILQYPVDVALDRSTRLAWAWKAEELPSKLREDSLPTHDYLSIAVEFDNGRDLTYMWSAALPEGKVFQCPLPWWDKRATHQVVRSDLAKLGVWLEEKQPVLDDYERAIGGELPKRAVAVWLIAASAFQKRKGICSYAKISLKSDKGEVFIGP